MSLAPDDILYSMTVFNLSKIIFIEIIPISFCPFVVNSVLSGPVIDRAEKKFGENGLEQFIESWPI